MIKQSFLKFNWMILLGSCLLSLFTVVSYAFQTTDSIDLLVASGSSIAFWLFVFIILSVVAYILITVLYAWMDHASASRDQTPLAMSVVLQKRFLIFFCIIYLCWMPWIVSHYPGLVRDDTIRQMMQTFGIEPYSNSNPLFDTWVFGLFWHLGDILGNRAWGLYIFGFVQAALTAASFSFALCYMEKTHVPKFLIFACLAAISLLCIFPLAAISMSKDSFNSWIFIIFFVLFIELCRSRGAVLRRIDFLAALVLVSILLIATKKTMLYVVLLAFIAFVLFNKGTRKISIAIFVPLIIVSSIFADTLMPSIMKNNVPPHVASTPPTASSTFIILPLQQTGRLLAEGVTIDPTDRANLERFIDCSLTAEIYNPRRADETVWATRTGATEADRAAYLSAWAHLGTQYPGIYAEALTNQVFGWFSPFWKIEFGQDLSNDVFDPGHMGLWSQYFPNGKNDAKAFLSPLLAEQKPFSALSNLTQTITTLELKIPALLSIGLWCTWIPLIGFLYALRKRSGPALLAFIVPGATLLSLCIGPMVLYWYAVPLFYIAPLTLALGAIQHPSHQRETEVSA